MSRVYALVVAVVVAVAALVAGRLLVGAADPDLREPVVVEPPGTSGSDPMEPGPSSATPQPGPPASWEPSIVPPPTVGPTSPATDDDSHSQDDADDVSGGSEADEGDDG